MTTSTPLYAPVASRTLSAERATAYSDKELSHDVLGRLMVSFTS